MKAHFHGINYNCISQFGFFAILTKNVGIVRYKFRILTFFSHFWVYIWQFFSCILLVFLRILSLYFTIQFFFHHRKKQELVATSYLKIQALFPAVANLSHNSYGKNQILIDDLKRRFKIKSCNYLFMYFMAWTGFYINVTCFLKIQYFKHFKKY